jgi:8-oxo-dGTP pyrophosphatase MutT (NUDIX family)
MIEDIKQVIKEYQPKIYGNHKKSAVLLPLIQVEEEWHVLYEVRSEIVSQAGDSSFPGGRVEDGETYEEAAVRETTEELNIAAENIKVHGEIDYIASDNLIIHCFVGELIHLDIEDIHPNEEVEKIYTVPLDYLLRNEPNYFSVQFNPILEQEFVENQEENEYEYTFNNHQQKIPYYKVENHSLWGFTANLTQRFIEIIKSDMDEIAGE